MDEGWILGLKVPLKSNLKFSGFNMNMLTLRFHIKFILKMGQAWFAIWNLPVTDFDSPMAAVLNWPHLMK